MYTNITSSANQIVVGGGTKTIGMFSKLLSQGSSFVMEGVKNLVIKRHVSEKMQQYIYSSKFRTPVEVEFNIILF